MSNYLVSKNYDYVEVHIRDLEMPMLLEPSKGLALMEYLINPNNQSTSHVQITDKNASMIVVRRIDITKVIPKLKEPTLKELMKEIKI